MGDMSIWSSLGHGDPPIMAINNNTEASNYRGEGNPDIHADHPNPCNRPQ
jgi:hypothetical protein